MEGNSREAIVKQLIAQFVFYEKELGRSIEMIKKGSLEEGIKVANCVRNNLAALPEYIAQNLS